MDNLPINEEDKQAILKHHLDKKWVKDSRIKNVWFIKITHFRLFLKALKEVLSLEEEILQKVYNSVINK